jgi:hypothetical protein
LVARIHSRPDAALLRMSLRVRVCAPDCAGSSGRLEPLFTKLHENTMRGEVRALVQRC